MHYFFLILNLVSNNLLEHNYIFFRNSMRLIAFTVRIISGKLDYILPILLFFFPYKNQITHKIRLTQPNSLG